MPDVTILQAIDSFIALLMAKFRLGAIRKLYDTFFIVFLSPTCINVLAIIFLNN